MQFQVPQFIEVEDKIFGPLTFRQFIYMGGGLGASYIIWRIAPIYISGPIVLCVVGLAVALAFFQFNGRPFIVALENGFFFLVRTKLYLWNNIPKKAGPAQMPMVQKGSGEVYVPKISDSKLHELAWSLDIEERIAAGVGNDVERHVVKKERGGVMPIRVAKQALVK